MLYARAVAALGDRARAREEFEVLVDYFAGLEARARYAEVLLAWQETERCRALLEDSRRIAKRMPGSAREINKEWLHAGRDAVDRRDQRAEQRVVGAAGGAPARQQVDLQQTDRVDVGIAQADRLAQAGVAGEQFVERP